MRNQQVVELFVNGTMNHKGTKNLHIESGKLVNYSTTLAQWKGNKLIVNTTKYSTSTSKIQTYIRNEICGLENVEYVDGQRQGTTYLEA